MSADANKKMFRLSSDIERYLAVLTKLYTEDDQRDIRRILVNAQIRIQEEWSYDARNGGVWGHALFLTVPEPLFLRAMKEKEDIEETIKTDLNKIHHIADEFVEVVFLEMDTTDSPNWRQESGLMIGKQEVADDAMRRIWGNGFRVFLSHKTSVKAETAVLKDRLRLFGVSAFVAHEDIYPTKIWQNEIENALASADGFVALMTGDFHESDWTDQEVGYALARGIPVVAVRLGRDPYGFIGKFQAISTGWEDAPGQIARAFVKHEGAFTSYILALRECSSWDTANVLAQALPGLEALTERQANDLVSAYNGNYELRGGWGFNGEKPKEYGQGLLYYLNQRSHNRFRSARLEGGGHGIERVP